MPTPRATPSSADVAMEVSSLLVGLGILTMALFPFALPAARRGPQNRTSSSTTRASCSSRTPTATAGRSSKVPFRSS